jgi:2-C-methyl-D-erythritol 4-phosphate cytidylyltransferase
LAKKSPNDIIKVNHLERGYLVSVGVVIPAAGIGKRMGTQESKQFLSFQGSPIFLHTLRQFETHLEIDEVVITVREEEIARTRELITQDGLTKVTHVVIGGASRQESVFKGLQMLHTQWVLVHDAVRPFVTHQEVTNLLIAVKEHKAAVLAVPVKSTMKLINNGGFIDMTPERSKLREIQTPQAFEREILMKAHTQFQKQSPPATDDSMLVEQLDVPVKVVDGQYTNIKITTPEDIKMAEVIHEMMCKVVW